MRSYALQIFVSLVLASVSLHGITAAKWRSQTPLSIRLPLQKGKLPLVLGGVGYFHRWSGNTQHEFTPRGQGDLQKWADMITVNVYPSAHDGDALAVKANAVLENYKSHGARVVRTDSIPHTPDRPAEHFIAVVFGRPDFLEAALARFKLMDGVGCSIVYSHRIYGAKVGDQMSRWLNDTGSKMEKTLMDWNGNPSPTSLRQLPRTAKWRPLVLRSGSCR